ncbi:uncharacterized protein EMH_0081160 [Eimeria mitis]|uniref:Uncharacterized protein n=1 Tax=Eimeria mitis TaxID=44415 RepID=U6K5Q5_9EIME|nr:uncharacterized protein EMH_0081160 [Eimeria mitis]CDJ33239.1 hypothetical protein EMH_0081160 [Eimeria mitis]
MRECEQEVSPGGIRSDGKNKKDLFSPTRTSRRERAAHVVDSLVERVLGVVPVGWLDGHAVVAGLADVGSGRWRRDSVEFCGALGCVEGRTSPLRMCERLRPGQLGDRWLSSAWLRFTRDVGIASICRGVHDADSRFLTNWEFFVDRFSGGDTVGMAEGRLDALQQAGGCWMGTQWWRDWLTWGLGGGREIPSSFCEALGCVDGRTSPLHMCERLRLCDGGSAEE